MSIILKSTPGSFYESYSELEGGLPTFEGKHVEFPLSEKQRTAHCLPFFTSGDKLIFTLSNVEMIDASIDIGISEYTQTNPKSNGLSFNARFVNIDSTTNPINKYGSLGVDNKFDQYGNTFTPNTPRTTFLNTLNNYSTTINNKIFMMIDGNYINYGYIIGKNLIIKEKMKLFTNSNYDTLEPLTNIYKFSVVDGNNGSSSATTDFDVYRYNWVKKLRGTGIAKIYKAS